ASLFRSRHPAPPALSPLSLHDALPIWGPGEEPLAREVADRSTGAATLLPQTSIADVAALARRACLFVTGDTGPAHIAGALGTPRSEEHTSELQSLTNLVCRLLLEKKTT